MIGPSLPPSMAVERDAHHGDNILGASDYHQDLFSGGGLIEYGPQQGADASIGSTSMNGLHPGNGPHLLATNGHHHEAHLGTNGVPSALIPGLSGSENNVVPSLLQATDLQMTAISNLLGKEWGNGVVPSGSMGDKVWTLLSLRVKAIDAAAVQSASLALLTLVQG